VSGTILIYGATGYTGKLIAKAAADAGARPILAGRPPAARERAGIRPFGAVLSLVVRIGDPCGLNRDQS
jgi:NAD(P)-dependent dehydrogenase (short-subunit alcohol dehydrogenase family)